MIKVSEIDAQMERILESSEFANSARSAQFLLFCVEQTVKHPSPNLKETTIAVELFGRPASYDPKKDPIVRVHASRVREKLNAYYSDAGASDHIRIDLPKGGYMPAISRRDEEIAHRPVLLPQPVHPSISALEAESLNPIPSPLMQSPRQRRSILLTAGILLLVSILACFAILFSRHDTTLGSTALSDLQPLDTLPGFIQDPVWSPDGTQIAFSATNSSTREPHIYIQNINNGGPPKRVTLETVAERRPVWAADGNRIAFTRAIDSSHHFEVTILNLRTGALQPEGQFLTYWRFPEDSPALDWSPNAQYLVTAEQISPLDPARLILLNTSTGERSLLTSPPSGSSGDIEAKFSPDGQRIAFRRGAIGDLYTVSVQGEGIQPATRLTFDARGIRGICWVDHGKSILYGTPRASSDTYQLWNIPASGGAPQLASAAQFDAIAPAVSVSGRVVFTHRVLETDLIARSLDSRAETNILLSSDHSNYAPRYSPDGNALAFLSNRTGFNEMWLLRLGHTEAEQLTHFHGTGRIMFPSWSPDSKNIVFSVGRDGASVLYRYSFATNTAQQLTWTTNRHIQPTYSDDGNFIYYNSNDEGVSRISRIHADGSGHPEALFWDVMGEFLLSSDGKWIYFAKDTDGVSLVRGNLQDHSTEQIFHTTGRLSFIDAFAMAGSSLYLAISHDSFAEADVLKIDPSRETSTVVAHLDDLSPSDQSGFSISPDGRSLLFPRAKRNESLLYTAMIPNGQKRHH